MSDLKDTLLKFTRSVGKTSGELLKSTKLSLAITSEEDKLKQIYMVIGKKVHEIYQYGGGLGTFFDEKYKEIQQTETVIQDLKNQMNIIKGVKTCPKCGANIDRGAGFCPKCGLRIEAASGSSYTETSGTLNEEPAPMPEAAPEDKYVICRNCQSQNEPGSRFCLTCGRMI